MAANRVTVRCWASNGCAGDLVYSDLPLSLTINRRVAGIKTLQDVERHEAMLNAMMNSPTSNYVKVDHKTGIFYCDQQDCRLWGVNKSNQVVVHELGMAVVANSIPEFLTRILLEDAIEMKPSAKWTKAERAYAALLDADDAANERLRKAANDSQRQLLRNLSGLIPTEGQRKAECTARKTKPRQAAKAKMTKRQPGPANRRVAKKTPVGGHKRTSKK